jgi:hypothetical protein
MQAMFDEVTAKRIVPKNVEFWYQHETVTILNRALVSISQTLGDEESSADPLIQISGPLVDD